MNRDDPERALNRDITPLDLLHDRVADMVGLREPHDQFPRVADKANLIVLAPAPPTIAAQVSA
jgi:hypothetical protein